MFYLISNLSARPYAAGKRWADVERMMWFWEGPDEEVLAVRWMD